VIEPVLLSKGEFQQMKNRLAAKVLISAAAIFVMMFALG
jgi:hypothetical protein